MEPGQPAVARRPLGVTITAVAVMLGSVVVIVFALLMQVALMLPRQPPNSPGYLKAISGVAGLLLLGFAGWGIRTAVGLFRLRHWSRWSMLIFSGLLVFIGGIAALSVLIVPVPSSAADPALITGVKAGIAVFYGSIGLIGVFWLVYFNAPSVRAQFGSEREAKPPGGRPISIFVIACFLLIGSLVCSIGAFLPFPAWAFGLFVKGWAAHLIYLIIAAIQIWLGAGLLRLNPLSRRFAIVWFLLGAANSLAFLALPGYAGRLQLVQSSVPATNYPLSTDAMAWMQVPAIALAVLPIWFLSTHRKAFGERQAVDGINQTG